MKKLSLLATKEEIIAAGLIGICKDGDDIEEYVTIEEAKRNPLFDHWFNGDMFDGDFSNIWLINYGDEGIYTYSLINY